GDTSAAADALRPTLRAMVKSFVPSRAKRARRQAFLRAPVGAPKHAICRQLALAAPPCELSQKHVTQKQRISPRYARKSTVFGLLGNRLGNKPKAHQARFGS